MLQELGNYAKWTSDTTFAIGTAALLMLLFIGITWALVKNLMDNHKQITKHLDNLDEGINELSKQLVELNSVYKTAFNFLLGRGVNGDSNNDSSNSKG